MATTVKNLKGTGDEKCTCCDSWLDHWVNNTGTKNPDCAACSKKADVGGHVKKVDSTDGKHYIIPLCSSHNATDGEYTAYGELVPASKQSTCAK